MAAFTPLLVVAIASLVPQVAVTEPADELLALSLRQRLDSGLTDRRHHPVGPFRRRDGEGSAPVDAKAAALVFPGPRPDQKLAVGIVEPHRQDVRVTVEADEAQLAHNRASEQLEGAWIQLRHDRTLTEWSPGSPPTPTIDNFFRMNQHIRPSREAGE